MANLTLPWPSARISVLIPAFNEEQAILQSILETAQVLAGHDYEIIVIDDGSHDQTYAQACLSLAANDRVRVVHYDINQGKGHALRYGFQFATGDLIVFLDADLELHPRQIISLLEVMQREGADVVIGSKRHPASKLVYPWHRRIVSFVYFALVKLFFGLPIRDTQTGIKLFKTTVLRQVMPRLHASRFAYDLEILALAHHFGYGIAEAPVVLTFQRKALGRISWKDIREVWLDTVAIFWRMQVRKTYDQ